MTAISRRQLLAGAGLTALGAACGGVNPQVASTKFPTLQAGAKVNLRGSLETLVRGAGGAYAVSRQTGRFGQTAAITHLGVDGSTSHFATIPNIETHNFGAGTELSDGTLALTFQGTEGFLGQRANKQGVALVGNDGKTQIIDLANLDVTRPIAALQSGSKFLVVASNGSVDGLQVQFSREACVCLLGDGPAEVFTLAGAIGAGAASLIGDQLQVATTQGRLLRYDLNQFQLQNTTQIPEGLGLGNIDVDQNAVVISGSRPDRKSLALLKNGAVTPIQIPDITDQTFVRGAEFVNPETVLFNLQNGKNPQGGNQIQLVLLHLPTGETKVVDASESSVFAVSVLQNGANFFSGASGVGLDAEGEFQSSVRIWNLV